MNVSCDSYIQYNDNESIDDGVSDFNQQHANVIPNEGP